MSKRTKIIINEVYHAEVDSMNFTLFKTVPKFVKGAKVPSDELVERRLGYYQTMQRLLQGILKDLEKQEGLGDVTIEEYLQKVKDEQSIFIPTNRNNSY